MAGLYTYEDFRKAAEQSGLIGQFSSADLKLAQNNPDAGMKILGYKQDWSTAPTDEARALAHEGTEKIRADFGGYSGGTSGSGYDLFSPQNATGQTESSYQPYSDPYAGQIGSTANEILSYPDFSYDPEKDPNVLKARESYGREAERATADVLGKTAAATGGIPSSYAVSAAGQAGNNLRLQLSDAERAIYDQAYQRYLDKYGMLKTNLGALQGLSDTSYGRYADQRNYENTDGQQQLAQEQQRRSNALNMWGVYGYATPEIAAILGVPEGTPTSDQSYRDLLIEQTAVAGAQDTGDNTSPPPYQPNNNDNSGYSLNGQTLTSAQYKAYQALESGNYGAADFNAIVASGAYSAEQLTAQGYSPQGSQAGGDNDDTGGAPIAPAGTLFTKEQYGKFMQHLSMTTTNSSRAAAIQSALENENIEEDQAIFLLSLYGIPS